MYNMLPKLKSLVEKELMQNSGHSMCHIDRVLKNAMSIASEYSDVDIEILQAAAILHDIARVKEDLDNTGKIDHAEIGAEIAEKVLKNLNFPENKIPKVKHCIKAHRARSTDIPQSLEARILFDADKLDLLGSVGLARIFMIAGEYGQQLHSPEPLEGKSTTNFVEDNINGRIKVIAKHSPNHEYLTKIIHLPNRLYTEKARLIAADRIKFMDIFFVRLRKELDLEM